MRCVESENTQIVVLFSKVLFVGFGPVEDRKKGTCYHTSFKIKANCMKPPADVFKV